MRKEILVTFEWPLRYLELAFVGCKFSYNRTLQVFGIVQSKPDFKEQHLVMDGCSDLIMEIFGKPVGYHARSAIGTNTLPLDVSVEIEAVVEVKP